MSLRSVLTAVLLFAACHRGVGPATIASAADPGVHDAALALAHPFFPLRPGATWTYLGEAGGGEVREEARVLEAFEAVGRTRCVVLQQERLRDGRLEESTLHFFAGDLNGRLWLYGEETFDAHGRRLADSWRADRGVAPIAWLPRAPQVGEVYDLRLGDRVETTEVLGLDGATVVPGGAFAGCLITREGTPEDGDLILYAPGVGRVQEADADSHLELVDHR